MKLRELINYTQISINEFHFRLCKPNFYCNCGNPDPTGKRVIHPTEPWELNIMTEVNFRTWYGGNLLCWITKRSVQMQHI